MSRREDPVQPVRVNDSVNTRPKTATQILLVDDEESSRYAVTQILRSAGFSVKAAEDYRDALQIIEDPAPLDLLITDVVMPNRVNGFALARMARMRRRDLKVLYISAFDNLPTHEAQGPFLRKPLTEDDLLATVRGLLVRTEASPS